MTQGEMGSSPIISVFPLIHPVIFFLLGTDHFYGIVFFFLRRIEQILF